MARQFAQVPVQVNAPTRTPSRLSSRRETAAASLLHGIGVRPVIARAPCACGGSCPACRGGGAALRVSEPIDPAEREAEHVAGIVMRAPEGAAPVLPAIRADPGLASALQRDEGEPPPDTPVADPRLVLPDFFDRRLDWFEMSRPFATRGADLLTFGDTRTYLAVGNLWRNNYRFFADFGLSDKLSADAANFVTPFAIDSALKRDFPTPSELFERNADITSFVISPTVFTFDLGDIPGTLRSPLSVIFGGNKDNPYRRKPRHTLGRKADSTAPAPHLAVLAQRQVDRTLAATGSTLPSSALDFFNTRFGRDFSAVRVHTGSDAAASARAVGAKAYTVGRDIVFGAGRYDPHGREGRHLLAHELTHVVQQGAASPPLTRRMEVQERAHTGNAAAHAAGSQLSMSAADPAVRVREPRILRTPDRTQERLMTPDSSIQGQTYPAPRCGANPGCTLSFQFLEASTGTRPAPESRFPSYWRGARVRISGGITPACGPCQSLEMVQTIRNVVRGADGALVSVRPIDQTYARRAGYEDANAPAATLGWAIDAHATSTQPLFTQSGHGMPGDTTMPAEITDEPGSYPHERNTGKEFNTYLLCVNGAQSIPLGYVRWGYWIDEDGNARFEPAQPQARCGALDSLFDAAARWNSFSDLIDLDVDRSPPAPSP